MMVKVTSVESKCKSVYDRWKEKGCDCRYERDASRKDPFCKSKRVELTDQLQILGKESGRFIV